MAPVPLGGGGPVLLRRLPASVLTLVAAELDGPFAYLADRVGR